MFVVHVQRGVDLEALNSTRRLFEDCSNVRFIPDNERIDSKCTLAYLRTKATD